MLCHRHLPHQLVYAGLVIGKNQRQQQENNISTRADSSHFVPTITIR